MPDFTTTTTQFILFKPSKFIDGQLTFGSTYDLNLARDVIDADASGTASPGDWFGGTDVGYTGFTTTIAGDAYALFAKGDVVFLPHNGELSATDFSVPLDVAADADAQVVNCFLAGTLIATPTGERTVETLEAGDLVRTADGRDVPLRWLARQKVDPRFGPPERLMPVRVDAGALGDELPHTDLVLTTDHALFLDGVLVHAGALVNDTTIHQVPLTDFPRGYTVYHIETRAHDLILANGSAAETFVDNASRRGFDNYLERVTVGGPTEEMDELPYPRAMSARQVPARLKRRLAPDQVA